MRFGKSMLFGLIAVPMFGLAAAPAWAVDFQVCMGNGGDQPGDCGGVRYTCAEYNARNVSMTLEHLVS
jgi:hypothetical protein